MDIEWVIIALSCLCYITVLECDSASLRIMSGTPSDRAELVLVCVPRILDLDQEIIAKGIISDLKCFNISIMDLLYVRIMLWYKG